MTPIATTLAPTGFPVAFTFAGVAVIFGVLTQGVDLFGFMPYRIMSVMQNTILMAVPLFIFMGNNAFNNKPIIQATWVATFLANFKGQISKIKAIISNQ
jgi:TRAP-type mannitol/chloroaromatic compound transport system permease large subunit